MHGLWVGAAASGVLDAIRLTGRIRWWGGVVWGLIIEVGMMVTPPMVVAMDTGYFGLKFGPGLLVTSFIAHVAYGAALGLLAERYVAHTGGIFSLLGEVCRRAEPRTVADAPDTTL